MSGGQAQRGCAALLIALGALSACDKQPSEQPAARAAAAVAITPPSLYNNTGPIPGNGGLLIWSQFGSDVPAVDVRSTAAPEAPIAGSIRELGSNYSVWTANTTMPEGTYAVHITSASSGDTMDTIEVTAPRTFGKPALMNSPSTMIGENDDGYACCWNLFNQVRVDMSCFGVSTKNFITLIPGVTTTESASALTQLLFDTRTTEGESVGRRDLFQGDIQSLYFDMQSDQYCFDLVATEIATGEQYTFEELDRCAPHGEQPDFTTHPLEPTDDDLDRLQCAGPPAGYEERWCDLNDAACAAEPTSFGCALAGHVCHGEPLPEPMTTGGNGGASGTSGFGGASGTAGSAGMAGGEEDPIAGSGGTASGGSASKPAKHVTACSASPQRAHGLWIQLALLAAALGLLVSRRS